MAQQNRNPQDVTGRRAQEQSEERDQKLEAERSERGQRLSEEERAQQEEVRNAQVEAADREQRAFVTGRVLKSDEIVVDDAVEVGYNDAPDIPIDRGPDEESVEMRVNTDIDQMVFGRENTFSFKRGSRYKVPRSIYDHLDSKGYVYH